MGLSLCQSTLYPVTVLGAFYPETFKLKTIVINTNGHIRLMETDVICIYNGQLLKSFPWHALPVLHYSLYSNL